MTERGGSDFDLWLKQVREAQPPELDPFLRGLSQGPQRRGRGA
ncbi:hypothetical protein ACFYT3_24950 [Nocardia amikacinitolerans]